MDGQELGCPRTALVRLTPLQLAAIGGHADAVRTLLAAPGCAAATVDAHGFSGLRWAAVHGHADVAALLSPAQLHLLDTPAVEALMALGSGRLNSPRPIAAN